MYPPHSPSTQWPCLSVSEWVCQGLWGYEESESLKPACSRRLQSVVWPRHETWPSNLAHGRYLDVSSRGLLNFTLLSPSPAQVAPWLHTTWQLCHCDSTHTHVTAWERPLALEHCSRKNSNNIFLSCSCYVWSRKYFPRAHLTTSSGVGGCKMKVGFRVQFHTFNSLSAWCLTRNEPRMILNMPRVCIVIHDKDSNCLEIIYGGATLLPDKRIYMSHCRL